MCLAGQVGGCVHVNIPLNKGGRRLTKAQVFCVPL